MNGLGQKCSYFLNAFLIKWRNDVRDYKLGQYHEITNPRYLNNDYTTHLSSKSPSILSLDQWLLGMAQGGRAGAEMQKDALLIDDELQLELKIWGFAS